MRITEIGIFYLIHLRMRHTVPIAVLSATIQYAGARFIKDLNAFSREKTKEMSCGPKEKKHLNFL